MTSPAPRLELLRLGRRLRRRRPARARGRRGRGLRGHGRRRLWSAAGLPLLAAAIAGCATAEPRAPLPFPDPPPLTAGGQAEPPDRWWTALGDPALDARVEAALAGSFTLDAARERLREARAVVRRAAADLEPRLDGTASGTLREGDGVDRETELGLGLEAGWELDLWGRLEATVEAERRRFLATAEDYRAAAITLSAEVALAWFELTEATRQLELARSQLETNRTVLEVLEERFEVGQSGAADVLRQRQLVEATREQLLVLDAVAAVLEHRLAVLEGRPPQAPSPVDPPDDLPVLPGLPGTGLPAELLGRRPDVRAALRRLEASDAEVAAAVRDQYPRLDLSAALRTTAERPSGLFSDWLGSLTAQLTAPLLDGGLRAAEIERTEAVRRRRLAEYGAVALEAFREVEDALAREASQVDRIDSLRAQLDLAERTLVQLRTQYLNGAADFIDVLTALREQQALERSLLTARLDRVRFRVALHRALAGGFPTPADRPADPGADPASAGPPEVAARAAAAAAAAAPSAPVPASEPEHG